MIFNLYSGYLAIKIMCMNLEKGLYIIMFSCFMNTEHLDLEIILQMEDCLFPNPETVIAFDTMWSILFTSFLMC